VRGLNRLVVRAMIPRKTEDALNGLGFLGHSPETLKRLPAAMAECYFTFDPAPELPDVDPDSHAGDEPVARVESTDPDHGGRARHRTRARRAPVGRARPFRRRRDRETSTRTTLGTMGDPVDSSYCAQPLLG